MDAVGISALLGRRHFGLTVRILAQINVVCQGVFGRVFDKWIFPAAGSCGQPTTKPLSEAETCASRFCCCVARDFQSLRQPMRRVDRYSQAVLTQRSWLW
jgi:hypothetical protein